MHKLSGSTTGRLAIGDIVIATPLVLALAGCAGASTSASGQTHTASPVGKTEAAVAVPKYVASLNARKEVRAGACKDYGAKGWRLAGTATNSSKSARGYTIVVDFVSRKGDTVLDTKVVEVAKIAPKKSAHWSAAGAAGQAHVSCVIRQALVRS